MKELERLYKEIHPKVYAFFYVKTSSREVAEDLTQDVFYEAMKGLSSFKGKSTLQTWIFSIARNLLFKYYRSNKYQRHLKQQLKKEEGKETNSPEHVTLIQEEARELIKKIKALNDLQREIVILRIYAELSFKEIGELIQKSENYARVTFHRVKLKLQKEMEGK